MTFLVTLTKEAVKKGYTASVSGVANGFSGSKANEDGTVTYYTDNNTLTGGIMASQYVITISDSEKNVVARMYYNLATYANAVDIPMVDAFYSFGKAAVRARHYLSTL